MADLNSYFKTGAEVEISSNDEGFRGAWYSGTVIRPLKSKSKSKRKIFVQYKTLMADEAQTEPLREELDVVQLRPPAPRERCRSFMFSEEVDAYHNDGWWEGVITEVHLEDNKFSVFFRSTREQMEFGPSELRLHREWVNGKWVPPIEEETESTSTVKEPCKEMVEEKFGIGTLVEVSSDEDGFQGAWFGATIVEQLSNEEYLIEYQSLRNDDDTELLKEKVDSMHIRPYPPETVGVGPFSLLEKVDALYNDGWWVGVISEVLKGQKYIIYFRGTDEEMEFKHSGLRLHQDWIDGKWVTASRALNL